MNIHIALLLLLPFVVSLLDGDGLLKPGDLCKIINPIWHELSDIDICLILRPISQEDGIDIYANCYWWVMCDGCKMRWATADLELIE